jgi:hypothetical protein
MPLDEMACLIGHGSYPVDEVVLLGANGQEYGGSQRLRSCLDG